MVSIDRSAIGWWRAVR